jgi:MFS family permease
MTAKTWQQFSVGRAFAYLAVGIVENIVPSYQAELAPGDIRGFFAGSIQVFVHIGGVWAAAVTRAYATEPRAIGWLVPTAQQLIPAFLLVLLVPFCAESPRFLLEHNQEDHALRNLNKIRPKNDVDSGKTVLEIKAIDQANKEAHANKVSGVEFLKPTYIKRAIVSQLYTKSTRSMLNVT